MLSAKLNLATKQFMTPATNMGPTQNDGATPELLMAPHKLMAQLNFMAPNKAYEAPCQDGSPLWLS